ncbi:hypothetical protein SAMN04490247_3178 [Salimicrobium halophilum]|uniref:Uncharacterized protein n=1 Tax=Salimicrobium halophilum TaxID=86666 RepID=A0A1G8WJ06_9BACI|nr:hypothetical protein SAMN04490247_3178 [Salimicrobium halophilum]
MDFFVEYILAFLVIIAIFLGSFAMFYLGLKGLFKNMKK